MSAPLTGLPVTDQDVSQHTFAFSGKWPTKGPGPDISVYLPPKKPVDATDPKQYVFLTHSLVDPSGPSGNYDWAATADLTNYPTAWPQGGLVRFQVNSGNVAVSDTETPACLVATPGSFLCASPYAGNVATVVSTSPAPAEAFVYTVANGVALTNSQYYLGRRGGVVLPTPQSPLDRQANTTNYYATVEQASPSGIPDLQTFAAFYSRPLPGAPAGFAVVNAIYYNYNDLGLGRDMSCWPFPTLFKKIGGLKISTAIGVACLVTNYGRDANGKVAFGQDPETSIAQAIKAENPIATVAMAYDPALPDNPIVFYVFDGALTGAIAGVSLGVNARLNFAALDNPGLVAIDSKNQGIPTHANIAIPDNCLTCHGPSSVYNPAASGPVKVTNARFLPFDPSGMRFSTKDPAWSKDKMLPLLQQLNALVALTPMSTATTAFLKGGLYSPSVASSSATLNEDYVPPDWESGGRVAVQVYNEVVKPYCRTCHLAHDSLDWSSWQQFVSVGGGIEKQVCGDANAGVQTQDSVHMPQSERTQTLFWQSPARAHLLNGLGGAFKTGVSPGLTSQCAIGPVPMGTPTPHPISPPPCLTIERGVSGVVADTQIASTEDKNFGAGLYMNVGTVGAGQREGLVRFDLSPIPAGAQLTSALLTLTALDAHPSAPAVELHGIFPTTVWTEGTATWAGFYANPAPQFAAFVSTAANAVVGKMVFDVQSLVALWLGGVQNNGMLVSQAGFYHTTFATSENPTASNRPKLVVCYVP